MVMEACGKCNSQRPGAKPVLFKNRNQRHISKLQPSQDMTNSYPTWSKVRCNVAFCLCITKRANYDETATNIKRILLKRINNLISRTVLTDRNPV